MNKDTYDIKTASLLAHSSYVMGKCAIQAQTILVNEKLLQTAAQKWCHGPRLNSDLLRMFHKDASQSIYTFNKHRFYSWTLINLNLTQR